MSCNPRGGWGEGLYSGNLHMEFGAHPNPHHCPLGSQLTRNTRFFVWNSRNAPPRARAPAESQPASREFSCAPHRDQRVLPNANSPHLRPEDLSVNETPSQEELRKVLRGRLAFPHHGCPRPQNYDHCHYRGNQDHETHSETDLGFPREMAAGSVPRHLAKFVVGHGAPWRSAQARQEESTVLTGSEPAPPPFFHLPFIGFLSHPLPLL